MIKTVFFDIDDTLLSFSGYVKEAMKSGFEKFGLPRYTEDMYNTFNTVNTGLWHQIEQGTLTFEELKAVRWNKIFNELGIDFDGVTFEAYFRGELFNSAVLEPGAKEILEYLSRRYTLCVVSNGPFEQQINRLKTGGLYKYFSYFFISSDIGAQKPSKVFFDACFLRLKEKVLPSETVIIGDSLSADISGGKAAGIKTCLYAKGTVPQNTGMADYVVTSLKEIEKFL